MSVLKFENVSKKYGNHTVLTNINCVIDREGAVILGPSGAGKSTFLRCINMLDATSLGNIYYHNTKITNKNIFTIRKKIAMVFQQFYLFHNMTTFENLTYAPLLLNLHTNEEKKSIKERARMLLKKFNLETKENSLPNGLSGGQKQRVAICRALMMNPEVIMFDEPTSALDVESVKDLIAIIHEIEKTTTVIAVTHHVEFAKAIAKRIIFMDHGSILDNQTNQEFFNNPKSHRAKLFLENIQY